MPNQVDLDGTLTEYVSGTTIELVANPRPLSDFFQVYSAIAVHNANVVPIDLNIEFRQPWLYSTRYDREDVI